MATNTASESLTAGDEGKRERSTIEFPYMGLEDAVTIARGIHSTTGSHTCQHDQLAAAVGMSMNSSGYRMRLSAARLFGFIESDRSGGGVRLTELGQMVVDSTQEREAKAKAFLNVPLFKRLFETKRGQLLPPPAALEREMAGMGVSQKQTERARQVFQRSAEYAGFFEMDRSRLIMPPGIGNEAPPPVEESKPLEKNGGGGPPTDGPGPGVDPIIRGLLARLPKSGAVWPEAERELWLKLLAGSFQLIYKDKADGETAGNA
jgi:hypothetical protein